MKIQREDMLIALAKAQAAVKEALDAMPQSGRWRPRLTKHDIWHICRRIFTTGEIDHLNLWCEAPSILSAIEVKMQKGASSYFFVFLKDGQVACLYKEENKLNAVLPQASSDDEQCAAEVAVSEMTEMFDQMVRIHAEGMSMFNRFAGDPECELVVSI